MIGSGGWGLRGATAGQTERRARAVAQGCTTQAAASSESREGMARAGPMAGHVTSGWHCMIRRDQGVVGGGGAECGAEAFGELVCVSGHGFALAAKVGPRFMAVPTGKAKQPAVRFEPRAHGGAPAERVT